MKNRMKGHLINSLLVIGSLILLGGEDIFAQELREKNVEIPANLIRTLPQPNADPDHVSGESRHGGMLAAERFNAQGIIYSQKGEYNLAIAEFNKALEIDPRSAETFNNRGIAFSQKGEYDLAVSDFIRALEIKPLMANTYHNRGITYVKKGEYALALYDFDRALELDPNGTPAYINRGGLHAQLACSDWEKACELGNCEQLKKAVEIGLCIKTNGKGGPLP